MSIRMILHRDRRPKMRRPATPRRARELSLGQGALLSAPCLDYLES